MAEKKPGFREDDSWFGEAQLTQLTPADEADDLRPPVPTQMVSNGEYMPYPQTEDQKRVEHRVRELADGASKKLGMSRREFRASTGGMAASFLAMNEVFGRFFDVSHIEMFEPEAYAESGAPPNLFVLDDQIHIVRSSRRNTGPRAARRGAGFVVVAGEVPLYDPRCPRDAKWRSTMRACRWRSIAPSLGEAMHATLVGRADRC